MYSTHAPMFPFSKGQTEEAHVYARRLYTAAVMEMFSAVYFEAWHNWTLHSWVSAYGSVSKPCTPVVHIKIAGKWMFIAPKNGTYRYWSIATVPLWVFLCPPSNPKLSALLSGRSLQHAWPAALPVWSSGAIGLAQLQHVSCHQLRRPDTLHLELISKAWVGGKFSSLGARHLGHHSGRTHPPP